MENNETIKSVAIVKAGPITESDMAMINEYTLDELKAEDVFIFKLRVCDNDVDRVNEKFSDASLDTLKDMYLGKPILKDHDRKVDNQIARIFDTEVITDSTKTNSLGEPYKYLQARCYAVNTPDNQALIRDIKSGIKGECSVNFKAKKATCSICGTNVLSDYCKHVPGRIYNGHKCYINLDEMKDAYEVSLVAVPCQPKAGIVKALPEEGKTYEDEVPTVDEDIKKDDRQKELQIKMRMNENYLFLKEKGE